MKITNWLFTHTYKLALIVGLVLFSLYISTVPSTNVGYADSDEFLAVAPHWGLAHPPGYTLYVSLLHLAMKLPIPATTAAFRAHAITAISSAAAFVILTLLAKEIFTKITPKKYAQPMIFLVSLIITLLGIATSTQVWLYSQIAEKYIVAAPLAALLLYLGTKLTTQPKIKPAYALAFGFSFGLGLAHHQSFVFLLPFIIAILASMSPSKKQSLKLIGWTLGGTVIALLLAAMLLWIQISRQSTAELSWYSGNGIEGFINTVTRRDFRGEIYATNEDSNAYIPTNFNLSQAMLAIKAYFALLGQAMGYLWLIPLLVGIRQLAKYKNIRHLIIPFITLGPLLAAYLSWPDDIGTQAITQRFFLISYYLLFPLLFAGIVTIINRLSQAASVLRLNPKISLILVCSLPLFQVIHAGSLYPQISLKNFNLVSRLYQTILTEVKPNSLVTCYSDTSCFALLYEQSVNRLRQDVQVIPMAYPLIHNQLEQQSLQTFTYTQNPFKLFDIITTNVGIRPVYAVDINQYYFNLLGLKNGFLYYIPSGYKSEFARTMPETLEDYDYQITKDSMSQPIPDFDLYRQFLFESLTQTHISNAYVYLKTGDRQTAQELLNQGLDLAYRLRPELATNAQAARLEIEQVMPDANFANSATVPSADMLLQDVPIYQKMGRHGTAYTLLLGAITVDPTSIPARLELAKVYEKAGDHTFARMEYQHILILDPDNQDAIQALNRLP